MRPQLLDLFQVFTYGTFCVSIIAASMWFSKTSETSPNRTTKISFEEGSNSNGTDYFDWKSIFVSASSTLSLFSQEKTKSQLGEFCSFFGYLSFNGYHSDFSFKIDEGLKFTNILDQLHNSSFFF